MTQLAEQRQVSVAQLLDRLQPLQAKLLSVRNERERPLRDDKILCSWNGLAIRGLADAGRYCENPDYVRAAGQAADFVLAKLRSADGRLLRTYSQGEAKLTAYLDDYAFLVDGLIALHQATGDRRWLQEAQTLSRQQIDLYWDDVNGGFFFTARDHEELIARSKQLTDGAQPAGNSIAASNLVYLAAQAPDADWQAYAERTVRNSISLLRQFPRSAPRMASVLDELP